ncbi:hypothetical protein EVAR_79527_1 [Eumeta japonica]|uniref:Uncharacterized protein n=1 Tax=Eumeta variegata TaxID=151549 RepID=A0A4C1UF87_EUMVA|nr:hypothetical protein EVAR_79527_1 [Eumeta japonica]
MEPKLHRLQVLRDLVDLKKEGADSNYRGIINTSMHKIDNAELKSEQSIRSGRDVPLLGIPSESSELADAPAAVARFCSTMQPSPALVRIEAVVIQWLRPSASHPKARGSIFLRSVISKEEQPRASKLAASRKWAGSSDCGITLSTKYGLEVAISDVTVHPVRDNSSGSLLSTPSTRTIHILYLAKVEALLTPLGLRVHMSGSGAV